MNKGELIESVSASAGMSRADATKAVDAVLESVTRTLSGGGSVSLVGFGTFSVKHRAARMGRNPRTGEAIQIRAATRERVKPSKFGQAMCPVSRLAKP
jgi:DNA-binding protein HU-beta